MNNHLQLLSDSSQLDLNRHGMIEAHAGTGKTYTIVQMVLRILSQSRHKGQKVHIRDILLVTYTEKAAGELKSRIREVLEKRIQELENLHDEDSPLLIHLRDCLSYMHEALIGTIHGVCLRILQRWPFESRIPFQTEMVNDHEGISEALRTSMRTDWQQTASEMPWALKLMAQKNLDLNDSCLKLIEKLAVELLNRDFVVLDRRGVQGMTLPKLRKVIESQERLLEEQQENFQALWDTFLQSLQQFIHQSNDPKRSELAQTKYQELKKIISLHHADSSVWKDLLKVGRSQIVVQKGKTSEGKQLEQLAKEIQENPWITAQKTYEDSLNQLRLTFVCDASLLLSQRWQQEKDRQGLISFQDMLRLTHQALQKNPTLVQTLRQSLHYAIIDEFQDTSLLQWQIFRRLFLDAPKALSQTAEPQTTPILFLVGDPKQSIYSFQGADVNTYMEAKKELLQQGGRLYGLVCNYRSLHQVIEDYNRVLGCSSEQEPDWFGLQSIQYPSQGEGGQLAFAPKRSECRYPLESLLSSQNTHAIQPVLCHGSAIERQRQFARACSVVIRSLRGQKLSIPDGTNWKEITLDYHHFAIIVENHQIAQHYLKQFDQDGIPAVKYKLEGVFQSEMCHHIKAVLSAILCPLSDLERRSTALLTPFFHKHPVLLNPVESLHPESAESRLFVMLRHLAQRRQWGRFFRTLQEKTEIKQRLIQLSDGERQLADLRQIAEYCIECLIRNNWTLVELVDHLGMLISGQEKAAQEQNLFALSSEKAAVQVLTMHASKGLEFPVVFAATTSGDQKARGISYYRWIGTDHRLHLLPTESTSTKISWSEDEKIFYATWDQIGDSIQPTQEHMQGAQRFVAEAQRNQERRRLLYVALTRPQALLFVPLHLQTDDQYPSWNQCKLPDRSPERDLTPVLLEYLQQKRLLPFKHELWFSHTQQTESLYRDAIEPPVYSQKTNQKIQEINQNLSQLNLENRFSLQTSYTELSHNLDYDRHLGSAEEFLPEVQQYQESALPRGKQTGDALHAMLEECIGQEYWDWKQIKTRVATLLESNYVLQGLNHYEQSQAIQAAFQMVQRALQTTYRLDKWGEFSFQACDVKHRRAELEFQLAIEPDWMHGFMDVVFRLPQPLAPHPWIYFITDWKTNSLSQYDAESIQNSVFSSHYDWQAQVYTYALHEHLQNLLKDSYNPQQNLGGAVYIYLRGFEYAEQIPIWLHAAQPEKDQHFVLDRVSEWKRQRRKHD